VCSGPGRTLDPRPSGMIILSLRDNITGNDELPHASVSWRNVELCPGGVYV